MKRVRALIGFLLLLGAMPIVAWGGGPERLSPGARLLASPQFAGKKPNEQSWILRCIQSAQEGLVPSMMEAQSVIVYSLDPSDLNDILPEVTSRTHFHGFRILGRTTLWREGDLQTWRRAFVEGLGPEAAQLCFAPRHGIRLHTRTRTIDMVLCFECGKMRVYGWQPAKATHACFFDIQTRDWLNALLDERHIQRNRPG